MLTVCKSCLDTTIFSRVLALVFLIVHGMWSMRLQHHVSKAAILLPSALFKVQVSEAYKAIGNTRAWTSLTLVVLVIPLSAQILDRFVIAERAIAKRCLISWLQPPALVIRDPRKLNLIETDPTSLPSIMRGSSTLSGPMAMIFVLLDIHTLRVQYAHAAANLNSGYSKYAKVARVHYFCTIVLRTSRAVLTRAWASRRVDLRERRVDLLSKRVIIFCW